MLLVSTVLGTDLFGREGPLPGLRDRTLPDTLCPLERAVGPKDSRLTGLFLLPDKERSWRE